MKYKVLFMIGYLKRIRTLLLVLLTHSIALPLLKIFRRSVKFPYSLNHLEALPAGSLGNDLFHFLKKKNLNLLPHYARHDLKHILLQYDTTDCGEACLQCFMLGNGRVSFPVLATVIYALVTMPEYWKEMKAAYEKGRTANPINNWNWNDLLLTPTKELRLKVFTTSETKLSN